VSSSKACGVLSAIAIGVALPVCGIVLGALTDSFEPFLWSLSSIVLIGLAAIGWSGLRYDLLRVTGTPAPAKVTSASRIDLGPMDFGILNFYEVRYTYLDQNGVTHEGVTRPMRSIPSVTDPHVVRYDLSDPARSVWIS
jgi:hypothetical protein